MGCLREWHSAWAPRSSTYFASDPPDQVLSAHAVVEGIAWTEPSCIFAESGRHFPARNCGRRNGPRYINSAGADSNLGGGSVRGSGGDDPIEIHQVVFPSCDLEAAEASCSVLLQMEDVAVCRQRVVADLV